MTELMAIGASHKTAGVAVRERIALTPAGAVEHWHIACQHDHFP